MTHITHFKQQPINIHYWDYYILCRLNAAATIALQRMEYWDGTKEDGNAHAEDINEVLEHQGQAPTQDTDRWVYKAMDELQWELMGVTGEKKLPKLIDFLVEELHYLERRNNPLNTWDRKKQYGLNAVAIQDHINYLGYIISYFKLPFRRLTPVFYAIEVLTREGIYIDRLNVDRVYAKIESFKEGSKIPHFLKSEIEKFFQTFLKPAIRPFRTFAEWKAQSCGMHPAKVRNGKRKNAESIPHFRGSNSIEYKTENTNIDHKHNRERSASETDSSTFASETSVSSPAHHFLPTESQNEVESQPASYRLNEQSDPPTVGESTQSQQLEINHERPNDDIMVDSIPATPPAHSGMSSEQQPQGDTLHPDMHQNGVTGTQQGEVTAGPNGGLHIQQGRQIGKNGVTSITFEEMRIAQEKAHESINTPTSGESTQTQQLEQTSNPVAPGCVDAPTPGQAVPDGEKGDAKDAPATRVGGKTTTKKPSGKARYQITLQGQHIIDLYQELRKRRITLNDGNIKAANGLADVVDCDEDFRDVFRMIQEDPFLNQKNVKRDLDFMYRKYDGYIDQVVKAREYSRTGLPTEDTNPASSRPSVLVSEEKAQQNIEAAKARVAARKAASALAATQMAQTQMAL